jgi:hypothetical protein
MHPESTRRVESASGWREVSAEQRSALRRMVQEFGFGALEGALDADLLTQLQAESAARLEASVSADVDEVIRFRARMGTLGDTARRFLGSQATLDLLQEVFAARFELSDDASCFTYYGSGDRLGVHCDRATVCVVTMIVYLHAESARRNAPDTGLVLKVYGRRKPAGEAPRLVIPTTTGCLVVGRGGETWHERPQLQQGEQVTALTACFSQQT